jgi:hypothetical protein
MVTTNARIFSKLRRLFGVRKGSKVFGDFGSEADSLQVEMRLLMPLVPLRDFAQRIPRFFVQAFDDFVIEVDHLGTFGIEGAGKGGAQAEQE